MSFVSFVLAVIFIIRYFNASQKHLSTTLITSMSTVIHHILVKKLSKTSEDFLTIDFWSNRHMRTYLGITVHFFKLKAAQSYAGLQTIQRPSCN